VTTRAAVERTVLLAFAAFMIAVPWLLPALIDRFWVSVIAEILIWSLFAASVNLLFGYVGLLSFGQALFFGFGMYGVAIGITNFGLSFWPALGLGIGAAMAMALVTGILAVRLTWHYFAIITLVFSLIFYFLALTLKPLTGGDDGINFALPPTLSVGGTELSLTNDVFQYFFILATVAFCFYLLHRLVASPLGKAFMAVRDNDVRASLIGLNVYRLRLLAFVLAGFLAGVSGALFAFFGRYASASYMFYQVSGEAVVWAIVGGAGTLFGPIVGTSLFIMIREIVSTHWEHHALIVGVVAILTVIFAPRGVVGFWRDLLARIPERGAGKPDNEAPHAAGSALASDGKKRGEGAKA
jgi:branched-chain amino acid transport system permease protein